MENREKTELAYRLCESGKFQEALKLFKELVHDSTDPAQKAGYLIDEATCYAENGDAHEVSAAVTEARKLVSSDTLALAQIDFFQAILLVENDKREEGERALACIVAENPVLLNSGEGRELYEKIQIQRGLTLMHLSKYIEARPILEEALSFQLEDDVRSNVHCHLGRYYHELRSYALAKEQFVLAQRLKVPEDWEGTFHYYYGYTL